MTPWVCSKPTSWRWSCRTFLCCRSKNRSRGFRIFLTFLALRIEHGLPFGSSLSSPISSSAKELNIAVRYLKAFWASPSPIGFELLRFFCLLFLLIANLISWKRFKQSSLVIDARGRLNQSENLRFITLYTSSLVESFHWTIFEYSSNACCKVNFRIWMILCWCFLTWLGLMPWTSWLKINLVALRAFEMGMCSSLPMVTVITVPPLIRPFTAHTWPSFRSLLKRPDCMLSLIHSVIICPKKTTYRLQTTP